MAIKCCWGTNRRGSSLKGVMKLKEIGHDQSPVGVALLVARLVAFRFGPLLRGISRCVVRGVRCCVLRCGRFGVGFRRLVFCGVVARPVAFCCVTLPCGALCCGVLLLLSPVGLVGLSFCGVVLWQWVWSLSVLSVVVWLSIGVL